MTTWDPWEVAETGFVAEEGQIAVTSDIRLLRRYERAAEAFVPKFRLLAQALETKKVAVFADRIEERVVVIRELSELMRQASPLIAALEREHEELAQAIANGAEHGDLIKEAQALQAYRELLRLSKAVLELEFRISDEDENQFIDWTLDEYLGYEAVIHKRFERLAPESLIEASDFLGTRGLYGVLAYYSDAETTLGRIEDIRYELEGED